MYRKLLLPALALAGALLSVYTVVQGQRAAPVGQPVHEPARSPFARYVAGAGMVEASTENIAVGTNVEGVVTEVLVKVGQSVERGTPLFRIDTRDLDAQLGVRRAALETARRQLEKLRQSPRPEDVTVAEAALREAKAILADAREQLARYQRIVETNAASPEELRQRQYAVDIADAKVAQASAALERTKAGTWQPDLRVAEADVAAAEAEVRHVEAMIARATVRSEIAGQVLQVNVRPGEFAAKGVLRTPLMMLGDTRTLHVRVDVDENDAWRIRPNTKARATVRGNPDLGTDLSFVRIDPYVVPKRSLTGDSAERVDTRVLQVLFAFDRSQLPVYVGQQMDVFIDAAE